LGKVRTALLGKVRTALLGKVRTELLGKVRTALLGKVRIRLEQIKNLNLNLKYSIINTKHINAILTFPNLPFETAVTITSIISTPHQEIHI